MSGRLYKHCCVPNCDNTRENDILHVFPNPSKDPDRFKKWLRATGHNKAGLDEAFVFKHRRICHSHFETKYYTISKRLSPNAVPTLNLKVTPESLDELIACHSCLAMDRVLHSVDAKLMEAYKSVIGDNSSTAGSPLFVCSYCRALLVRYIKFRNGCHRAKRILEEARTGNKITTAEHLKQEKLQLQYEQTKTNMLSINCIGQITFDSLTCQFQEYPSDERDDHVPQHGTIADSVLEHDAHTHDASDDHNVDRDDDTSTKPKILNLELTEGKANVDGTKSVRKGEKIIGRADNAEKFEKAYNVVIEVLSEEQQFQDVLDRKHSANYLHSPYKCDLCYKGFMDEEILNRHVVSQHDASRGDVVCRFCSFRYRDRRALNQHLKSHRLKFCCRLCSFVSRTTFNAREHYKMHGGLLHQCAQCGKSYEKLTSYLSHMRIHHPSEFMWCELCGEAFIREFGLNSHKKRVHRDISLESHCVACDSRFASPAALQRHAQQSRDSTTCRKVACAHCGEGFEKSLALRDHLLKEHRILKIYTCEKCGKTFSREALYSAHYRRKHVAATRADRQPRLWVCEVCGKTLQNKCLLLYHQRNHTGERPYQCVQCPKSFTLKKLLQSHLRVHSTARPYACSLCPKTFKGLSALRTHEHMHSQGRVRSPKNTTAYTRD